MNECICSFLMGSASYPSLKLHYKGRNLGGITAKWLIFAYIKFTIKAFSNESKGCFLGCNVKEVKFCMVFDG